MLHAGRGRGQRRHASEEREGVRSPGAHPGKASLCTQQGTTAKGRPVARAKSTTKSVACNSGAEESGDRVVGGEGASAALHCIALHRIGGIVCLPYTQQITRIPRPSSNSGQGAA